MAAKDCIDAIHDAAGRTLSDDEVLEIAGGQVSFFFLKAAASRLHAGAPA